MQTRGPRWTRLIGLVAVIGGIGLLIGFAFGGRSATPSLIPSALAGVVADAAQASPSPDQQASPSPGQPTGGPQTGTDEDTDEANEPNEASEASEANEPSEASEPPDQDGD